MRRLLSHFPGKDGFFFPLARRLAYFFGDADYQAYFQAIEPDFKEDEENSNQWIVSLNRLSKINVIWFMLLLVCALFLIWYIPEVVKFCGKCHHRVAGQILVDSSPAFRHRIFDHHLVDYLQYKLKINVMPWKWKNSSCCNMRKKSVAIAG